MEVTENRKIRSGKWYQGFVEEPEWGTRTIKTGAQVSDTVSFIQKVIRTTPHQTRDLAPRLKGQTLRKTCQKIWKYVYEHIEYQKDAPGIEQVRSPARTLYEQKGDCDCMATLIGSILTNLNIAFRLRVTKYRRRNYYQHIYVIVPKPSGGHFTLDPVVEWFDYEEPFTAKKDIPMDLQYLNGPVSGNTLADYDEDFPVTAHNADAEDLFDEYEEIEGLGLFRRRKKKQSPPKKKNKKKGGLVKVLHAVNKFNPATVALRAGILAAAKLGKPGKMWEKLLWAMVPDSEARSRGANMVNHAKVKGVFERVKKIFRGAGGKPENLEKALVTGKVNQKTRIVQRHRALSAVPFGEMPADYTENSSLLEILGPEIYNQEIVSPQVQMEGLSPQLGAVATGGALAVAMTALGAIAAVVAKIGEVKQAAGKLVKDSPSPEPIPIQPMTPTLIDPSSGLPVRVPETAIPAYPEPTTAIETSSAKTGATDSPQPENESEEENSEKDKEEDKPKKGFFRKENIPLIAVGGLGLTALGIWGANKLFGKKKEKSKTVNGLEGAPKKKRKKKKPAKKQGRKPTSTQRKRKASPRSGTRKKKAGSRAKRKPVNLT